ncbi:methyltransferase domain-containing [Paramuricea clavata]|uniref:Methyltransferase domain-containing n=1 Tax=Paramuricea clavata TaxID=317549 RepID=A0A7D9ES78_PARCT|nr:methyltransferase domain-containing [Paramuricea clavata]
MFPLLYTVVVSLCGTAIFVSIFAARQRKHKREAFKKQEKNEFASNGTKWNDSQQEYYVEKFYETGLTGTHEYHGGYLNFGYWKDANDNYVTASEQLLSQVADPVQLNENSRLLDVANGMGAQDIFYFNKYKPKHIDMIDVTLSHHLICKKRVEDESLTERLTAHYGSATDLPFSDNSFTHVFSIEGGVHYRTRRDFLKEAYRVLEPNGWLSLADYANPRLPKNWIESKLSDLCAYLWNMPKENICSCEELKKYMEEAGLVDVVVKDVGEFCIPGYCDESLRPEMLAELRKVRGWFATYVSGRIIDELIRYVYNHDMLTEVIAYGRKPHNNNIS